jgi:hypothetical protein
MCDADTGACSRLPWMVSMREFASNGIVSTVLPFAHTVRNTTNSTSGDVPLAVHHSLCRNERILTGVCGLACSGMRFAS